MNLTCNYSPSKKRGLRVGQLRSLEILLGLIFQSIEGSETWISALLQGGSSTRPVFRFRVPVAATARDPTESLLDACRKSSVLKEAEQFLGTGESADDDDESTDTYEHKLANTLENLLNLPNPSDDDDDSITAAHLPISPINTNTGSTLNVPVALYEMNASFSPEQRPPATTLNSTSTPSAAPAPTCSNEDSVPTARGGVPEGSDRTQLPCHWPQLLDLYFSTTHCWFPVCQKHELLRTAYFLASTASTSVMPSSPDSPTPGDCALLWAVLACASHHWDRLGSSVSQRPHDVDHAIACSIASTQVSSEPQGYDGGHARAWLLLSLIRAERGQWAAAWMTVGRAVYIASCHEILSQASKRAPCRIDDGDRRTFLGCFILETFIASRLQRRPYFQRLDIQLIGLLSQDGMEEWEPWLPNAVPSANSQPFQTATLYSRSPGRILSIFNHFSELIGLMNELLQHAEETRRISHLREADQSLQIWRSWFPQDLGGHLDVEMPPQLLNLHLAFACVSETLGAHKTLHGDNSESRNMESWIHLRGIFRLLGDRIRTLGISSLPPGTKIYLHLIDQSLALREHVARGALANEQTQSIRDCLKDLEQLWQRSQKTHEMANIGASCMANDSHRAAHRVSNRAPVHLQTQVDGPMSGQLYSYGPASSDNLPSVSQPTLTSVFTDQPLDAMNIVVSTPQLGQVVDPALMDPLDIPEPMQESPIEPRQENNLEQMADRIPGTTNFAPDIDFMSLEESMAPGESEKDALFDSLTMLDPTDWMANPPEFMKHLGVLDPASQDLHQTFFNG
ncbi:hypothetical protein GQ53DRAFT_830399 [Thozetella sp. PMI_491]|nr:hypothetical protein GQ53DRAFT_830399 [Thozetella sp. PMI_491]